jgi:death-on-curing protein
VTLLSREDIVNLNRQVLSRTGKQAPEEPTIINPHGLDYLVESIDATVFGRPLFSTIFEQAARYAQGIITDHIFLDGNKRTGLLAAMVFLEMNGWRMREELTQDEIVNFGLALAESKIDKASATSWFEKFATQ